MQKNLVCGIDFGTSNSAFAVANGSSVSLAKLEQGKVTLPSALFYEISGNIYFGKSALTNFIDKEEGRFMRSLKRILGTSLMGQGTVVNGRVKKFEDIIADFIRHMKVMAEREFSCEFQSVVMGRPVHFIDHDKEGDARAEAELANIARAVGFKDIAFQFEPIAAAFAHEQQVMQEQLALVVDIGGGTSDFTVIRLSPTAKTKADRSSDILANTGVRIGGNDFDKDMCLKSFMPYLGYLTTFGEKNLTLPQSPFHDMSEWSKVNFLYTPKFKSEIKALYKESHHPEKFGRYLKVLNEEKGHHLLSVVEECKINLTEAMSAAAKLDFIEEYFTLDITRVDFNQNVMAEIDGIDEAIDDCLAASGVGAGAIELVILTGGTTEVPVLKERVQNKFQAARISEENKLSSVGLGLGYDSQRKFL